MVERFVPGCEHRLLVVGGRMVAALRGDAAWIVGDGSSTVAALIDSQLNADPMRDAQASGPLFRIRLDPTLRLQLSRQGLSGDSVPAPGRRVLIQRNGNITVDVTDRVHPSFSEAAALAARVVGLDIAGIDLLAEDISRPMAAQRAAIVEVNAGPGLDMHLHPTSGSAQPVGRAIVDHLFPSDDDGRIPVVGIAGSGGTTTVARLVARLLHLDGLHVGLACAEGLFMDRRRVEAGDCARFEPAQRLLMNRSLEAAVIENGPRMMVTDGLAYDHCEVGVVTRLDPARTLTEEYIEDADQLYKVLRTQVDVVLPRGVAVLNAADPMVAQMGPLCDGAVIFFATEADAPEVAAHRGNGGRAVLVRDGRIVLATGDDEVTLADLDRVPLAGAEPPEDGIESVLAAVGAAWALGVPAEILRAGIETFEVPAAAEAVAA
jgi:cyanophycin synthetase